MKKYDSTDDAVLYFVSDMATTWRCDKCGTEYEDAPGYTGGGPCSCGGTYYIVKQIYCH
jgi:hypothetical protein